MKSLIIILFLASCASKNRHIEFNPTDSMCLDAVVANIHSAGCHAVTVEKSVYGITKIYCQETENSYEGSSSWINNEFFAIAFGTHIPEDTKPICTDPFVIMTAAEKD